MHIPSEGFIIFRVTFNKDNKAVKQPFFHGLSTLPLDKEGIKTKGVLAEMCYKLSKIDEPTYYYYEVYDQPVNIQILGDSKQKLDS